ncbi:hypothetical protein TNCV_1819451 [Trichonephila clavipes]|nr:hypothetical protein TNCV_1819451 [Trichonephila clavipes]
MSTFNIPILPFFCAHFLKTTQLSCRRKQFNSPPQLENQSQCRRKTTQLVSRNETQQEKTTQLGNMNETIQQEKTTKLSSRNGQLNSAVGTKQLNSAAGPEQLDSSVGTKQLNSALPSTACNRLQPPAPSLQQNRLFLPTYGNKCWKKVIENWTVAVICQKLYLKCNATRLSFE